MRREYISGILLGEGDQQLRVDKIMVRISTVALISVLICRFILYINGFFAGDDYDRRIHFSMALFTSALSFILISFALTKYRISWRQIGFSTFRSNAASFLIGTAIWIIPASIGLSITLIAGWAEIRLITEFSSLILNAVILYIIVFLMEAFPEEIILRGFIYSNLNILFPRWIAVILQTLIFSLFAFFIGAMYSFEQIMFIPGFGFMLGYIRAKSGNVWTSIGFHAALMTASQILNPIHGNFVVNGIFAVRFFAFNLVPYILGAIALEYIYPHNKWNEKFSIYESNGNDQ